MAGISKGFSAIYSYINILSIDVAIGACIMGLFVASLASVAIPPIVLISLGISVWLIYTIDHLKDAKAIQHQSHTKRHQFHQVHFHKLKIAVFALLFIQIVLLAFLPFTIFLAGLFLMLIVILYFLILWSLKLKDVYHKEIIISVVYSCGIFLPTVCSIEFDIPFYLIFLFVQITMIAFSNLLLFSLLEMYSDKLDNHASLALVMGKKRTKKTLYSVLTLGLSFCIILFLRSEDHIFKSAQIIISIMNLTLISVLSFRFFSKSERFRYLGDGVFFLPFLHFLWL